MSYWTTQFLTDNGWWVVGGGSNTRNEAIAFTSKIRFKYLGRKFRIYFQRTTHGT